MGYNGRQQGSGTNWLNASHNFIFPNLVTEVALWSPTSNFVVKMGNGNEVTSQGICKCVSVEFQELIVAQDFYLFPLEDSEVVLGLAWLDTIGDVIASFMEFWLIIIWRENLELYYKGLALCFVVRALEGGETTFMI